MAASSRSFFCRLREYLGAVHDLARGEALVGAKGFEGEEKGEGATPGCWGRDEGDSRARNE
jgi:hypothetical protein